MHENLYSHKDTIDFFENKIYISLVSVDNSRTPIKRIPFG